MKKTRIRDLAPGELVADAEAISYMLGDIPIGTLHRWAQEDGWPRRHSTTSRGRRTEYSIAAAKATYERQRHRTEEPSMTPQTFRKKPVEIQAMQWSGGPAAATPIIDWVLSNGSTATWTEAHEAFESAQGSYDAEPECIRIETLEGTMRATPGDFVIQGVKGEFYPCKPDIFDATYESVLDT